MERLPAPDPADRVPRHRGPSARRERHADRAWRPRGHGAARGTGRGGPRGVPRHAHPHALPGRLTGLGLPGPPLDIPAAVAGPEFRGVAGRLLETGGRPARHLGESRRRDGDRPGRRLHDSPRCPAGEPPDVRAALGGHDRRCPRPRGREPAGWLPSWSDSTLAWSSSLRPDSDLRFVLARPELRTPLGPSSGARATQAIDPFRTFVARVGNVRLRVLSGMAVSRSTCLTCPRPGRSRVGRTSGTVPPRSSAVRRRAGSRSLSGHDPAAVVVGPPRRRGGRFRLDRCSQQPCFPTSLREVDRGCDGEHRSGAVRYPDKRCARCEFGAHHAFPSVDRWGST